MSQSLTNLERVRLWLKTPAADLSNDTLLEQIIVGASAFILNYCGRETFASQEVTDVVDTFGNSFMVLRESPVQSVSAVGFFGQTIGPVTTPGGAGYLLERQAPAGGQQRLTLIGHAFPNARSATTVTYVAGYQASERHTIPATPFQVETVGFWSSSISVIDAQGSAYTEVAASPSTGQFAVSDAGVYTFAAADVGEVVTITFGTVPADIVQAATELVGERFKTKDRIGQSSQSLAGKESVAYFSTRDMNAFVSQSLRPYRRVI